MHRASSTALHSWRTTRLARRVSSANAVARIKRPATTTPTDDIRKPDLQLSHFLAMERSSMKLLHLEPITLGGYPPATLRPSVNQNSPKTSQGYGEPKSGGKAPHHQMLAVPTPPAPDHSTSTTPQQSLDHVSSPSPNCIPRAENVRKAPAPDVLVDGSAQSPCSRRRFFHHHLTEAIQKRRVASAWHIYEAQMNRTRKDGKRGGRSVPTGLIHSLFALLAGAHPQTRLHYVRMRELADVLQRRGRGNLREWEWNALINAAGQGFRKTTAEDYRTATQILEEWEAEMRLSKDIGHSSGTVSDTNASLDPDGSAPSIQTYNILISIATRTGSRVLYEDAVHRLQRFTGKPDGVTYLTRITHYRKKRQLDQIPPLLERMIADGWPLQTDAVNAVIWAYASNGHLDTARQIYDAMITTKSPPPQQVPSSSSQDPSLVNSNPILSIPSISKSLCLAHPDHRTYIMMIQAYAQVEQLPPALDVLQDYLTAISAAEGSPGSLPEAPRVRAGDKQMTAAFRGLFLGFVKHSSATAGPLSKRSLAGMSLKEAASALLLDLASPGGQSESPVTKTVGSHFNTESLLSLFRFYLVLTASHISEANHPLPLPSPRFIRTVLLAFRNTAAPEVASSLLNDVWKAIVSERLEPCGRKWVKQKDGWVWQKVRRDFGVCEQANDP